MVLVRPENSTDYAEVAEVITAAFGQPAEAELVNRLRAHGKAIVSLVAESNDQIVGHILFSEVTVENNPRHIKLIGLAPLAVVPAHQRSGIGAELTRAGLSACRAAGYEAAIVLGHPEYYPRFGFASASRFGLTSEYDVRDEVFMALELIPNALADCRGLARYQEEFNEN